MIYSDAQLDAMLKATGQTANIDDGSLPGLDLWCKLLGPQQILSEYSMSVQLTDPSVKVRTSAIQHLVDSYNGIRGRRFFTGNKDYKVKMHDIRRSGFTILSLEDWE